MPEESTASTEHALMQEITAPLSSLPENPVPAVADVDFPIVLRGYDRLAVDAYVKRTSQLVAELQATRSPEAAVRRALERVGEEVASILQRAHDAASQITAQSRSEAEDRLEAARQEAAHMTADSQRRLKELDAETDRIWAERHRIVEDAQDLARQLLAIAGAAAERFPAADDLDSDETAETTERSTARRLLGEESKVEDPLGEDEVQARLREVEPEAPSGEEAAEALLGEGESIAPPGEGESIAPPGEGEDDSDSIDRQDTAIIPPLMPEEGGAE